MLTNREGGTPKWRRHGHAPERLLVTGVALTIVLGAVVMELADWLGRVFLFPARIQGRALVVISHDDRYFGVAGRVVHMAGGRIDRVSVPAAELSESKTR